MINSLLTKVIGSKNDRMLKKLDPIVESIYPIPLSSQDPDVDTLERRFLEWLKKA